MAGCCRHAAVGLLLVVLGTGTAWGAEYRFGVVPQQSATDLAGLWMPLLRELSARSGHELRFATALDVPTYELRLARGGYDFAYMDPLHYCVFSGSPGYRAIARDRGRKLRGIVVVRKESTVGSLRDLSGKRLALPARGAFAASVLVRNALRDVAVPDRVDYVGSHDSVYRGVARGPFDAGGRNRTHIR